LTADARKDVKPIGTPLGIENYPGLAGAMIAFLRQDSDSANANAQRVEAGEQQQKLRRQECRSAGVQECRSAGVQESRRGETRWWTA
jgi:hypothetical protein